MHIISSSSNCLEVADTAHGCCSAGLCAVAGSWCKACFFWKEKGKISLAEAANDLRFLPSAAIQGLHISVEQMLMARTSDNLYQCIDVFSRLFPSCSLVMTEGGDLAVTEQDVIVDVSHQPPSEGFKLERLL